MITLFLFWILVDKAVQETHHGEILQGVAGVVYGFTLQKGERERESEEGREKVRKGEREGGREGGEGGREGGREGNEGEREIKEKGRCNVLWRALRHRQINIAQLVRNEKPTNAILAANIFTDGW